MPITVTSDGSCLPHAVSRALVGVEIFYDCLRACLGNYNIANILILIVFVMFENYL